ncbi:MAG: alpha-D-ribose 1-methylphosphonate 5-triphosphate synthase subunit PhnH [Hyphomicrobiales bacterium]|jgi:alpha-D-ribose 1-methylphosphonate 5-triphosphate synthase subunit PhnH
MNALAPAFADPVDNAQSVFRAVMDAMARPGSAQTLAPALVPPAPLSRGAGAIALALLDYESPFWLDEALEAQPDVAQWLRFHTGAPIARDAKDAAFAFLANAGRVPDFESFAPGTAEYPDRSTTLVLQVEHLSGPAAVALSGPGIATERQFAVSPCPADLVARLQRNHALFPRGLDLLFVTADAVAAIPRSTRVTSGD